MIKPLRPTRMHFVFAFFLLIGRINSEKEDVERERWRPPVVSREDIVPKNVTLPEKLLETGLYKQKCMEHKKCELTSEATGKVATKYYDTGDSRVDPHLCTSVVSCGWVVDCDGWLDSDETCYDIYKKEIVLGSNGARNCKAANIAVDIEVDGALSPEYECGVPDEADTTQPENDSKPPL